jgi:hypothetical protein
VFFFGAPLCAHSINNCPRRLGVLISQFSPDFCRSYMSTDIAAVANVTETEKSLWSEFVVGTRIASAVRCSMFIYYWSEQFCDVFFPPRSCKWAVTCLIQYTTETSTIVKHEQIQVYCYLKSRSTTCQQQAAIHGLETCKHHQKSETKWTYLVVLVFAFFLSYLLSM